MGEVLLCIGLPYWLINKVLLSNRKTRLVGLGVKEDSGKVRRKADVSPGKQDTSTGI